MNKRLVPRLRFKQFNDQFKSDKLGNLATKIKSYSIPRKYEVSNSQTEYIHYGDIHTMKDRIINIQNKLPNIKDNNYTYLNSGDLVLADASEDHSEIGKPIVLKNIGSRKIVSGLHTIPLRFKKLNSIYIYYLLNSDIFKHFGYKHGTGLKVFGISYKELSKFNINFPTLSEQQHIGSFFTKLDRMIELQSKKITHLKQLKKGYLQKMFPQKGKNVPRLRFDGFRDKWKIEKLNNLIIKGKSGGTPSTKNDNYYNGNINFLSINDMKNANGIIKSTEKSITQNGLKNSSAWIVPKGAITLSMYASVGKVAKLGIDLATSQAFFNMLFNEYIDSNFMYYTFQMINIYHLWYPLISTGTQQNLNATKINNLKILIPSIQEQNKIGESFEHLDKLIEQHNNKLTLLKQLKKAYLQKMFC